MSFGGSNGPTLNQPVGGGVPRSGLPTNNQLPPGYNGGPIPTSAGGLFDPNTGQIGGGAAIPVGNNFSNYLQGILSQPGKGTPNTYGGAFDMSNPQGIAAWTAAGSPMNQTMNMGDALNGMLSGRPGDPSTLGNYFNMGLGSNGQAKINDVNASFNPMQSTAQYNPQQAYNSYNPTQVNAGYNAPGFQQAPLNQNLNTNFQAGPIQQVNGPNTSFIGANSPNVMQGIGSQANLQNIVNPAANASAMQAMMNRQDAMNIGDMRERFGNQGRGSGAAFAEGNYRAAAAPQQALALDQITRDNNAQALTQRAQDLQNQQGNRGMDVQQMGMGNDQSFANAQAQNTFNLQNAQLGQQSQIANQGASIQQMQQQLAAAGMSNEAILGLNAQQLQQAIAQNSFNTNNAQFGSTLNQTNQSLNNQYGLQAGAQNLQAQNMNMQNQQFGAQYGLQQNAQNNQYGLASAQMNQQNQQFNTTSRLQNQQLGNSWNLGLQNVGVAREGTQAQSQAQALSQIMAALQQTQRIGTPQAENTVAPSTGSQIINGIAQVGSTAADLWKAWNAAHSGNNSSVSSGTIPTTNGNSMSMGMDSLPSTNSFSVGSTIPTQFTGAPSNPGTPTGTINPNGNGPMQGPGPGGMGNWNTPPMTPGGFNSLPPQQWDTGGFGGGYAGPGGYGTIQPGNYNGGASGINYNAPPVVGPGAIAPNMNQDMSQYMNPPAGQAYMINGQQYGQVTPYQPYQGPKADMSQMMDGMNMTVGDYLKLVNTPGTEQYNNFNPPGGYFDPKLGYWTRPQILG